MNERDKALLAEVMANPAVLSAIISPTQAGARRAVLRDERIVRRWIEERADKMLSERDVLTSECFEDFIEWQKSSPGNKAEISATMLGRWFHRLRPQLVKKRISRVDKKGIFYCYAGSVEPKATADDIFKDIL